MYFFRTLLKEGFVVVAPSSNEVLSAWLRVISKNFQNFLKNGEFQNFRSKFSWIFGRTEKCLYFEAIAENT